MFNFFYLNPVDKIVGKAYILSFLEFGKIITSFLDFIIINSASVAILWLLLVEFEVIDINGIEKKKLSNKNWKIRFYIASGSVLVLFSLIFFIITDKKLFCLTVIFAIATVLMGTFFYRIYRKYALRLIKTLSLITFTLVAAEILIFYVAILSYSSVKKYKKYNGTRIVFNNETYLKDSSHTLLSDSSNFYIGKTNNYIFIHHSKEGTTSIYPMSSVVKMEIKNKFKTTWLSSLID